MSDDAHASALFKMLSELSQSIGHVHAVANDRVGYKDFMDRFNELRREIIGKLDTQHQFISGHTEQALTRLEAQFETRMESVAKSMVSEAVEKSMRDAAEREQRAEERVRRAVLIGGGSGVGGLIFAALSVFGIIPQFGS